MTVGPIKGGLMNMEAFWSKPSVIVEITTTGDLVLVQYCDLLDWIRAKWLWIDKKIVPVSEKLRRSLWGFVSIVHRDRSQRQWTATVRHLICVTSGVGDWTADIVTVIDIATPRWRLKWSEDRSLQSCEPWARSAACIRLLAKLSFVTFSAAEPANWLYCCLTD